MKIKAKKISVIGLAGLLLMSGGLLTACSNNENAETVKSENVNQKAGKQIKLEGLVNVRDLGGYKTSDGKTIKAHRLLRGPELANMTENDQKTLSQEYKVNQIVDFRTDSEVKAKPDPLITGVSNTKDPVMRDLGTSTSQVDFMKNLSTTSNPEDYLIKANQGFISDQFSRDAYKKLFQILLENKDGATLWHCTAGKDRAGFGTALVLSALGVPKETVMKDYLLTNQFRKEENKKSVDQIAKATNNNQQAIDAMTAMMDVREVYLEAAYKQIEKDYGTMDGYLKKGLGLTDNDLKELQKNYLV